MSDSVFVSHHILFLSAIPNNNNNNNLCILLQPTQPDPWVNRHSLTQNINKWLLIVNKWPSEAYLFLNCFNRTAWNVISQAALQSSPNLNVYNTQASS